MGYSGLLHDLIWHADPETGTRLDNLGDNSGRNKKGFQCRWAEIEELIENNGTQAMQ